MSNTITTLLNRNRQFAGDFAAADMAILPKLRTVLLTCIDARVDPAHIFGLELGDAVVMRNNGGRVTPAIVQEVAALAFMVTKMGGEGPPAFEFIIIQHTQCGAQRFADPDFQRELMEQSGVDVSLSAITNPELSLREDVERLRSAPEVPGYVVVSGLLYDVKTGHVREVVAPTRLEP